MCVWLRKVLNVRQFAKQLWCEVCMHWFFSHMVYHDFSLGESEWSVPHTAGRYGFIFSIMWKWKLEEIRHLWSIKEGNVICFGLVDHVMVSFYDPETSLRCYMIYIVFQGLLLHFWSIWGRFQDHVMISFYDPSCGYKHLLFCYWISFSSLYFIISSFCSFLLFK